MMSRVVDVVEGEGEGAKSCAELNLLSSHNTRIIDFAHITVPYALNGHCRKNARNVTIGSSKYPMATESDEQPPSVLNEFLFRSLREARRYQHICSQNRGPDVIKRWLDNTIIPFRRDTANTCKLDSKFWPSLRKRDESNGDSKPTIQLSPHEQTASKKRDRYPASIRLGGLRHHFSYHHKSGTGRTHRYTRRTSSRWSKPSWWMPNAKAAGTYCHLKRTKLPTSTCRRRIGDLSDIFDSI